MSEISTELHFAAQTASDVYNEWDLNQSVEWMGNVDAMLGYAYCRTTFEQDQLRDFAYVERLTGLKDVVGKKISAIIPGGCEASPEFFEVFGRVILTGIAEKCETYLRPIGIWFSITDYSREREHFVAVFENITERKQATQALDELSQRTERWERILTTMLSSISDFAYIFDREGRFLFVNQPHLDLWGLRSEEAVGKDFFDLKYPDDLATELAEQIQQVFETRQKVIGETPYTNTAGLPGVYEYISSPAFAHDGTVDFVVGVTRNITERKHADTALRTSEAKFRVLAEAMPQIIWVTRPDGWHTHFNQRWIDFTGLTLEESLGHGWLPPFHPEDQPLAAKRWKHATDTGEPYEIEYRLRGADGEYRWMLGRAMPLRDDEGGILKWFGTCTDIHDLKLAEAERERINTLLLETSRQAGMTEVATSVLHNVGNVLNSVNVSCSVISDSVRRSRVGTVAKTTELLQANAGNLPAFFSADPVGRTLPVFISKLAQRLSEEQALVFAETQALRQNIEHIREIVSVQQNYAKNIAGVRENIEVGTLVEDAIRMNSAALIRHRVELIREFNETPTLLVEKHRVLQILVNLIRNAKHALIDSEQVNRQLTIRTGTENGHVAISVIDNGIGIAPENLTRIFTHGFTTKKTGHGFGLHNGVLAAQQMGGRLSVQSDGLGCGATFTLELPRIPEGATS